MYVCLKINGTRVKWGFEMSTWRCLLSRYLGLFQLELCIGTTQSTAILNTQLFCVLLCNSEVESHNTARYTESSQPTSPLQKQNVY